VLANTAAALHMPLGLPHMRAKEVESSRVVEGDEGEAELPAWVQVGCSMTHPSRGAGVVKRVDAHDQRGKPIVIQYANDEVHQYSISSAAKLRVAGNPLLSHTSRRASLHQAADFVFTSAVKISGFRRASTGNLKLLCTSSGSRPAFSGGAVEQATTLAKCSWGGQIVITEDAWEEMGDSLPSGTHVLSLGTHVINRSTPMVLMELVPNGLSGRNFPSLQSTDGNLPGHSPVHVERLTPGFRDSPHPETEMAIVFVSTHLPAAEEMTVRKAVELFDDRLRTLLNVHGGYECKEPEPCKFMMSFRTFEAAVRFSAEFHEQLVEVPWPPELLRYPLCGVEYDDGGALLYRGLRARVGVAFAKPTSRKPLSSGRAGKCSSSGYASNIHACCLDSLLTPP
jgi:hypothetical protein